MVEVGRGRRLILMGGGREVDGRSNFSFPAFVRVGDSGVDAGSRPKQKPPRDQCKGMTLRCCRPGLEEVTVQSVLVYSL